MRTANETLKRHMALGNLSRRNPHDATIEKMLRESEEIVARIYADLFIAGARTVSECAALAA